MDPPSFTHFIQIFTGGHFVVSGYFLVSVGSVYKISTKFSRGYIPEVGAHLVQLGMCICNFIRVCQNCSPK